MSVRKQRKAAKKKAAQEMRNATTAEEWLAASDRYIDAQHIGRGSEEK